ncbi:MAG: hypothetical protein ACTHQQ_07585 [Solirubrobacteraceae bacterium]
MGVERDRALKLAPDGCLPGGRVSVMEPQRRQRQRGVNRYALLCRCLRTIDGLGENRVGLRHLSSFRQRSTERRKELQAAWIVCREQGGRPLEEVRRRARVSPLRGPATRREQTL